MADDPVIANMQAAASFACLGSDHAGFQAGPEFTRHHLLRTRRHAQNHQATEGSKTKGDRKALHRLIENDLIRRVSYTEYRDKVQRVYGGPKGAFLTVASMVSLHIPLGERVFRSRKFDLRRQVVPRRWQRRNLMQLKCFELIIFVV